MYVGASIARPKILNKKRGIKMINLSKKQLVVIIAIGVIVISVIGYYIYTSTSNKSYEQLDTISEKTVEEETENVEKDEEEYIVVHIAGEVRKPGIVRIKEGARIADIIEQAEGLTDNANITNINLAYIIEDGQKITIPSKQETEETDNNITNQNEQAITEEIRTNRKYENK